MIPPEGATSLRPTTGPRVVITLPTVHLATNELKDDK